MIFSQNLHRVPCTLKIMVPVATGHDNNEYLLITYGVVPLYWLHALGPKGNRMLMALASRLIAFRTVHSAFLATADLVLLL